MLMGIPQNLMNLRTLSTLVHVIENRMQGDLKIYLIINFNLNI